MNRIAQFVAIAAAALTPGVAFAHPGHVETGMATGFLHPLLGLDHVLAMVAVGVWAATLGGLARWLVPLAFVLAMALGGWVGMSVGALYSSEQMIGLSVIVLGACSALSLRLPLGIAMALVGNFALFHGAAHGSEMPLMTDPVTYAAGFIAATVALHVAGLTIGGLAQRSSALRYIGAAITALGAVILFSA